MKTKKLRPMESISEPGIPQLVVKRLLEHCDTLRHRDTARQQEQRRIWIVECDGKPYTVAIDYKQHRAMIVRGDRRE